MKKIIIPLVLLLIAGCTTVIVPLKGTYEKPAFVSSKNVDQVWSNIIDMFANHGISIKLIDKASGLIVSEETSFLDSFTFEDPNGNLRDNTAIVVLNTIKYGEVQQVPQFVTGSWNIRIKPNAEDPNKTDVNVNLLNIKAEFHYYGGSYVPPRHYIFEGKSTGVFEKKIFEMIK